MSDAREILGPSRNELIDAADRDIESERAEEDRPGSARGRVMLRALVGNAPGRSFSLKVKDAVAVRPVKKGMMRAVELEVPEFERAILRLTGKEMCRCFVLEPATEGNRFEFPPFFIEGNYRVIEKINDGRRAAEVFRAFVPE